MLNSSSIMPTFATSIEAEDLLLLELDCGAQLGNLGLNLLVVGNDSGELANTVKAGS